MEGRSINSELVFAIAGLLGTDSGSVCVSLKSELERFAYDVEIVRVSEIADQIQSTRTGYVKPPPGEKEDERIERLMTLGNAFREEMQVGSAMVLPVIAKMRRARSGGGSLKRAFVINSLKHPDEVEVLRSIYGKRFLLLSVFAPKEERVKALAEKIRQSHLQYSAADYKHRARQLVDRDQKEDMHKFGQNMADCFPLADCFLDLSSNQVAERAVRRFVHLLFGDPFKTPTQIEMAMFQANAAALRSADLARQVGAVTIDGKGSLLTSGCNEVPQAGGGYFWPETDPEDADNRDHRKGYDSTARFKEAMLAEIFQKVREKGLLRSNSASDSELAREALAGAGSYLKGTRVASVIEFGRAVHAEMASISEAARRGIRLEGSRLVCTTFPCHMCARHIVAAGIAEVFYIEPYAKSMAAELYPDDIEFGGEKTMRVHGPGSAARTKFRPFIGVAPRRFLDFFSAENRKDQFGQATKWNSASAIMRYANSQPPDLSAEDIAIGELEKLELIS